MDSNKRIIIQEAAKHLLKTRGTTTTLDVKNYVRLVFGTDDWTQNEVSGVMNDMFLNQSLVGLSYKDTGQFRIYYIDKFASTTASTTVTNAPTSLTKKVKKVKQVSKVKKVSRTTMVDMIENTKGRFFGVVFEKVDGTERTLNCQVSSKNFMDKLGYINCTTSKGETKRINPRTLKSISIGGEVFKVK